MAFKKKRGAGQRKGEGRAPPSRSLKTSSPTNRAKDEKISLSSDTAQSFTGRLYTQCPRCKTVYRIAVRQLRCGRGEALCLGCQDRFNVLETLADNPSHAAADSTIAVKPPHLGRLDALTEREPALQPDNRKEMVFFAADVEQGEFSAWDRMEGAKKKRISPGQRLAWSIGSLLLLALLAVQFGLFEGPRLAQNERLRPWLKAACQTIGCRLSPFRALSRIQIVNHDLHPAPDGIDGYEFILVLSNRASLPQAFPAIKLILSGNNGAPLAARVFQPAEYLPGGSPRLMAVDELQDIRLLLAKPQREVGGFSFELL